MIISRYLFELFLSSHDLDQEDRLLFLGFMLFRVGVGIGGFYLFESFPLIPSIEEAMYSSMLLMFGGLLLLSLKWDKLPS